MSCLGMKGGEKRAQTHSGNISNGPLALAFQKPIFELQAPPLHVARVRTPLPCKKRLIEFGDQRSPAQKKGSRRSDTSPQLIFLRPEADPPLPRPRGIGMEKGLTQFRGTHSLPWLAQVDPNLFRVPLCNRPESAKHQLYAGYMIRLNIFAPGTFNPRYLVEKLGW